METSALRPIVCCLLLGMTICMMLGSEAGLLAATVCWLLLWAAAIGYGSWTVLQLLLILCILPVRAIAKKVEFANGKERTNQAPAK